MSKRPTQVRIRNRVLEVSVSLVVAVVLPAAHAASDQVSAPNTKTMWTVQNHKSAVITAPAVIVPQAVAVLPDGGAIIAGSMDAAKRGWASRVDASGTLMWTFTPQIPSEEQKAFEGVLSIAPTFRSIAVGSNGDTYLCGDVPREPRSEKPTAYIAQIDGSGRLVRQLFPAPHGAPTPRFQIAKCMPSDDGIVAIAQGTTADITKGPAAQMRTSTWLIWLDRNGTIERQVLVPASDVNLAADIRGFSIAPTDKGLIFTATDNRQTEFVSVDRQGQVIARKVMSGRFLLVSHEEPAPTAEAFGATNDSVSLLRLDARLNASHIAQAAVSHQIVPNGILQLAGGNLLVFGSSIHTFGERYRALAVEMSASLTAQNEIPLGTGDFTDNGFVFAAGQGSANALATQLVLARPLVPSTTPSTHRGAILDFIQLRRN